MKTLILIPVAISLVLVAALLWKELYLDRGEAQFGNASVAAIIALACVAVVGLGSLWLRRHHNKLIDGIWLSLWSVAVVYLAADILVGQVLIQRLSPPMVQDELVHHKLIPGSLFIFETDEFKHVQQVNNVGLRGEDIKTEKEEGTYRILMLGDSFTMGGGVRDEETFSFLLEELLNTAGRRVEVLNAGVDSYSPILSYRQLVTQYGPLLEPQLVVLNFDMSDLMQEVAYRKLSIVDQSGNIIGFRISAGWETINRFIDNNLYFTRLIVFYLRRSSVDREEITVGNMVMLANPELLRHTLADDDADRTEQWQNIFDSILKIREYCTDRGIDFLLTVYPWGHQVRDEEWSQGRVLFLDRDFSVSDRSVVRLKAFASNNAVDILDVFPAFRSYDGASRLYYDADIHWTASGHRIMAGELARYISDRYLGVHDGQPPSRATKR